MPKALEDKLKREASQHKGWSDDRKDAYVYGALRKTGWKPDREKHGSLTDLEALEDFDKPKFVQTAFYAEDGQKGHDFNKLDEDWGSIDCSRSAYEHGQKDGHKIPVEYFGPDTAFRVEEIDPSQYGRSYEPTPYRDYFKTEEKMEERTYRLREQDEYDVAQTPGAVTDDQPQTEAYGAVNHDGAGPTRQVPDNRSFESQMKFLRSNKDAPEVDAAVAGLDTHDGDDLK